MALRRNKGTSQTNGVAVTVANSDDFTESQFEFVSTGGTGTLIYDALPAALSGQTKAFKVTPVTGEARYVQYGGTTNNMVSSDIAIDMWVYRTANPSAQYSLIRGTNTAGTRRLNVDIDTTGHMVGRAENVAVLWTWTAALTLNAWNQIKVFSRNQGAAASYMKVALYNAAGTLVEEHTTNTSDRTEPIAGVSFGKGGTDVTTSAFWMTDLQVDTVAGGYIGDVVPTLTGTSTLVALVDYAASVTAGSLTSPSITQVSGVDNGPATSLATAKWSVPIPSTGSSVWRVSATTPGAVVLTDDVTVSSVAPTTIGPMRPVGTLPSSTWA